MKPHSIFIRRHFLQDKACPKLKSWTISISRIFGCYKIEMQPQNVCEPIMHIIRMKNLNKYVCKITAYAKHLKSNIREIRKKKITCVAFLQDNLTFKKDSCALKATLQFCVLYCLATWLEFRRCGWCDVQWGEILHKISFLFSCTCKGQLISECLFDFPKFPQKI